MSESNVTIFGLGYIGLPTAAIIASKGIRVHGVDINHDVIHIINLGKIHITEPYLEDVVFSVVQQKLLVASVKPHSSPIYLITVPTPSDAQHEPDITYVETATKSVASLLSPGDLVIIESTCPVGTTEQMHQLLLSLRPELEGKFDMAYCPERVLPGNILYELEHNDRIVGGINEDSAERAKKFYQQFVKGQIFMTDSRSAEMCKLVENAYRDVNIAFANELSMICSKADIDVYNLIRLANRHPRVNILQPGVGVGGHCIAVDPWFIISRFPEQALLMRTAREANETKREWVIDQIHAEVFGFRSKHGREPVIACMGLAYKPDIDDIRESPALFITQKLIHLGLQVLAVEPHVHQIPGIQLTETGEALTRGDIVVFLVKHKLFATLRTEKIELDFCGLRLSV